MAAAPIRCAWVSSDPIYVAYHDREWGMPVRDDRALFEKLLLDGFQAGLSWITILRKRERIQEVFDGFEPARLARWTPARVERALLDPGIVRNRLKTASAVTNARAYLRLVKEEGSFSGFLWGFVGGGPRQNARRTVAEIPARTPESEAMSRALLGRGFRFVGPTICYAFMQAVGMVNDHTVDCFRHGAVIRAARRRGPRR